MPTPRPRRYRGPKPDRRRALELLAVSPDGCTEAVLLAHRFSIDMMVGLVNAGLATAKAERMVAGGRPMEVACVDHGRRAVGAGRSRPVVIFDSAADKCPLSGGNSDHICAFSG
jgi:hypothetical protein